jgi:DNA polymerase-3 subunit epsilon
MVLLASMTNPPDAKDETGSAPVVSGAAPASGALRLDRRGTSRRASADAPVLGADEWDALEGMARTLTGSGWYRVIRRFKRRDQYASPAPVAVHRALFIDVETTGLDVTSDRIIELAAVPFEFDSDGVVYGVGEALSFFEDPGVPIPADITELTGISDETVRGSRIDDAAVNRLLAECVLVIAHNADFDRRMIERRLPSFATKHWACSQKEVPWDRFGCGGRKLDYLLFRACGEFHDGHRAVDDCLAGIHLLADARCDDGTPMNFLLQSAREPRLRVWALGAPFEMKDELKRRRYRWNDGADGKNKAWYRDVAPSELEAEKAWLREAASARKIGIAPRIDQITARDRYSVRS